MAERLAAAGATRGRRCRCATSSTSRRRACACGVRSPGSTSSTGRTAAPGCGRALLPPAGAARVYTIHGLPEPYLPPPAGCGAARLARARSPTAASTRCWRGAADAFITVSQAVERELVHAARVARRADHRDPERRARSSRPWRRAASWWGRSRASRRSRGSTSCSPRPRVLPHGALRAVRRRGGSRGAGGSRGRGAPRARRPRDAFPGQVPAREALAQLAVFVLSSHMESAPLALLEAMTAGVPVVATRVGGVPELVPDGDRPARRARRPGGAGGGDRVAARRPGAGERPGRGGAAARRGGGGRRADDRAHARAVRAA